MDRLFGVLGSLFALAAVALGAFGAHGLRAHFQAEPALGANFETAVRYHFYHALGLLFVAWATTRWPHPLTYWAGFLFVFGIVVFSGSLYILSITGMRWLGAITPIGGVAMLCGWACLAAAVWRSTKG